MLQLRMVKMAGKAMDNPMSEDTHGILHGTKVVKELIQMWVLPWKDCL